MQVKTFEIALGSKRFDKYYGIKSKTYQKQSVSGVPRKSCFEKFRNINQKISAVNSFLVKL